MATTQSGVIYYKLDPRHHYDGDTTKNCGLSGGEIDGNFNFLRGEDIKAFGVSEDKTKLTITRRNGEVLVADIHNPDNYDFIYDPMTGVLTVKSGDKVIKEVEGFLSEKSFHVYGDSTIDGDGTRYNPIGVSSIARTGTYQPVQDIIDVVEGGKLPELNTRGDRYITREKVCKFGFLYPLEGVKKLQKRLEEIGSEWRVPTKEDWDQLLNIVEDCPQDKTHEGLDNDFYGVNAGAYLKSNNLWESYYRKLDSEKDEFFEGTRYSIDEEGNYYEDKNGVYGKFLDSDDRFNFTVYPLGFKDRMRGVESIGGFGRTAAFWTSTEEDRREDMYVKHFRYDRRDIEQETLGEEYSLSLRLCKDYDGTNLYDVEMIDGNTVGTMHVDVQSAADRAKYDKTLIWSKENICFTNKEYGGVISKEWEPYLEEYSDIRYYINDWDGTRWIKHEITEGESIVIIEHNGVEMHEWRLFNGEFIDTVDIIKKEFKAEFDRIEANIENHEGRITALEATAAVLVEDVDYLKEHMAQAEEDIIALKQADVDINERIDGVIEDVNNRINEEVKKINDRIDEEVATLNEKIDTEVTRLDGKIDEETARAIARENEIEANAAAALEAEKDERVAADADLQRQIDENKVENGDDSLTVIPGSTDEEGNTVPTKMVVRIPEGGMIKVDEAGLYIDGDFSFGGNTIANNAE